jgi:hypothetical protein
LEQRQVFVTPYRFRRILAGTVPVAELDLAIDQNASFTAGPLVWIGNGEGVDITGTTATVICRQSPTDAPLVTLTNVASSLGVITYLPAVPNFPYLPPWQRAEGAQPSLITLWPFTIEWTLLGVQAMAVPYCRWSYTLTWPDGTAIMILSGAVTLNQV